MLEFQLVIRHEHHTCYIPLDGLWEGQRVWWGAGAERKAKAAARKLSRNLPAFHYAEVMETFTA
jgi:hypothetical protein